MRWDIVTLSLGYGIEASVIESDVTHFQNVAFPDCDEILVVNDASEDVGSGGSALNALIRTAERLCFRNGFTLLTESVLQSSNILIVLVSDARALLNSKENKVVEGGAGYVFETYVARAVKNAGKVAQRANQNGVWIIGSDSLWELEKQPDRFDLPQHAITGFTFLASKERFADHGWYKTRGKNGTPIERVSGMEFDEETADSGDITEDNSDDVRVILAFLYFPFSVSSQFLSLHSLFPVAASTYLGVDSNVRPLKLSIFFDFMLATCTGKQTFIENRLGTRGKVSENIEDRTIARKQIYERFRNFHGAVYRLDIRDFEYKQFPETSRSYGRLLERLSEELMGSCDVERNLKTELSIRKLGNPRSHSVSSSIISHFRKAIELSDTPESFLRVIYTCSLALSLASEGKGGLRNGPAKNPSFSSLMPMEYGSMRADLILMIEEILGKWTNEPSRMIRAARHLEMAAQHLIRNVVERMCAPRTLRISKNVEGSPKCVRVTAPARIDFFGGWLDTPPIFFSIANAAVVNMAVKLDGKNPITCWLTKIEDPLIEVCQDGIEIRIRNEEELFYVHDKPTETGSLVCACILATGFRSLTDFFSTLNCTGLRIETKSDLPHGSGLGTSSTIASAILRAFAALATVKNTEKYSLDEMIVHTVLLVEQIMTTGGGWQDQVGSLYPGLKKCFYVGGEETRIAVKEIPMSEEVTTLLERRLLLVYTGKTRLAKNILQEVIRNFFTCTETRKKLNEMAGSVEEFSQRVGKGDLPVELIEKYHETKNFMTRCEPPIVTDLLDSLKREKHIDVGWAAGAGGGGFVYLLLSQNTRREDVAEFLNSNGGRFSQMTCHTVTIPKLTSFTVETVE